MTVTKLQQFKTLNFTAFIVCLAANHHCGKKTWPGEGIEISNEANTEKINLPNTNESDPSNNPDFQTLNSQETPYLDVRGVGDSAWSDTHVSNPSPNGYEAALKAFDPNGNKLKGDLSFVNMETTFGVSCSKFWTPHVPGQAYSFTSHPNSLRDAIKHGFNLFGLSNNHSRDCHNNSNDGSAGIIATANTFETMEKETSDIKILWHGVNKKNVEKLKPSIKEFIIKGRTLKVAFASLYTGRASCPLSVCNENKNAILQNLASANADLRILSVHSQGNASQDAAVLAGIEFIQKYKGDIVFGHGPHVWAPVRVVGKAGGKRGVIFESLGNFLHPGLAAQNNNFVGRVLLDLKTLEPIQVQVLPVRNSGKNISASTGNARNAGANLTWKAGTGATGILYSNIKHGNFTAGN